MTNSGRLAWLLAGVLATITGIAIATAGIWFYTHQPGLHTGAWTVTYTGTPDRLVVALDTGDITVVSGPPGHIEVTRNFGWSAGEPRADEHWQGREFVIGQSCPKAFFGNNCSANYRIAVPPGVALNLDSATGDITVLGARTAQVLVNTDTGDVHLRFAAAPSVVRASTASGDIAIAVPYGDSYAVQADAASGNTMVSVTQDPNAARALTATADSGNIVIAYG